MSAVVVPERLPGAPADRQSIGAWGMMLFIATEAAFFCQLLFSYFYLASIAPGAWPPDGAPQLGLVLPNTGLLLLSSGTMWWAERGIRQGKAWQLRSGLLFTFILGAMFLGIQVVEYRHQHFTPASHAYGSLFFTITGIHGLHVALGLVMNLYVQLLAWRRHVTPARHLAVSNVAWYWHFVDLVWIVVFTGLYLAPNLR